MSDLRKVPHVPGCIRSRCRRFLLAALAVLTIAGITGTARATTPDAQAPRSAAVSVLYPLQTWWNAARGDNFATGNLAQEESAVAAGYTHVRREAWVREAQEPGTVPSHLFWHSSRGDNFSTATQAGMDSARSAGYTYLGVSGYVYPAPREDAGPIYQFWSNARQDNVIAVTQATIDSARSAGYTLVRIEGYAPIR